VVLALMAVMLAACGPVPRPFQPLPREAANPLVTDVAAYGVWVAPMGGMARPMSKLLGEAVVEGFKLYGIRATTDMARPARYRLEGTAEINSRDPSLPYVVLLHWRLYDREDKLVGEEVQGVGGSRRDWDYGSPAVIQDRRARSSSDIARRWPLACGAPLQKMGQGTGDRGQEILHVPRPMSHVPVQRTPKPNSSGWFCARKSSLLMARFIRRIFPSVFQCR